MLLIVSSLLLLAGALYVTYLTLTCILQDPTLIVYCGL